VALTVTTVPTGPHAFQAYVKFPDRTGPADKMDARPGIREAKSGELRTT
jgi:hypothetical protein